MMRRPVVLQETTQRGDRRPCMAELQPFYLFPQCGCLTEAFRLAQGQGYIQRMGGCGEVWDPSKGVWGIAGGMIQFWLVSSFAVCRVAASVW